MMLSDLFADTFVFTEAKQAFELKGSNMKHVIRTVSVLSILALFSASLASSSRLYIDDFDFDYSLDSLTSSADSYQGYSQAFDYDAGNDQADNVPAFLYFDAIQPDGNLRLYIATKDRFNTAVPAIQVTVPDGGTGIEDLKGDIGLLRNTAKNIETGLKLTFDDVDSGDMLSTFKVLMTDLGYQLSDSSDTSFKASLHDASYSVSCKKLGDGVQVIISGL